MAEKATILIPDISGFTTFTSVTALDHSAHIINELLELIIESNEHGFTLAEVEGDAVLFYRKGEPLSRAALVEQCLTMFQRFHTRLKVIERDTVCRCGACQTATHLTLKFIVHYGDVKEIRVAHFTKATGIDMIIAHRLLKNPVDSDEYILISHQCLNCLPDADADEALHWQPAREQYAAIGEVAFEYAELSEVRSRLPDPPRRKTHVFVHGEDRLEVTVERPLEEVYQRLINVDKRVHWMLGVDRINRDPVTERVGMWHNCQFMGMTMVNTCLYSAFEGGTAYYVERVEVGEIGLDTLDNYELTALDARTTRLLLTLDWQQTVLPLEVRQGMLQGIQANLDSFKVYCEGKGTEQG